MFHVEHGASDSLGGRAERNGGTANHGTEAGTAMERRAGTARKGAEAGRRRKRRRRAGAARAGEEGGACAASARSRAPCRLPAEATAVRRACPQWNGRPRRSGVVRRAAVEWSAPAEGGRKIHSYRCKLDGRAPLRGTLSI
jgi:hypothetical protein